MVRPDETEFKDVNWSRSQRCRVNQFLLATPYPMASGLLYRAS